MRHRRVMQRVAQGMGIPGDVALGMPRVLVRGGGMLLLENHRGIVEYGPQRLRVHTALGILTVTGDNLTLSNLGENDLLLTGTIGCITFVEGGEKAGLV